MVWQHTPYAAETVATLFGVPPPAIDVAYNGFDFDLLHRYERAVRSVKHFDIPEDSYVVGTTAFLKGWKRIP